MSRRYTTCLLLIAALPLFAVALSPEEKPAAKPAEPVIPVPPKLEPKKNYTEKTGGWKTEVLDPDTDPPKTRKVDLTA